MVFVPGCQSRLAYRFSYSVFNVILASRVQFRGFNIGVSVPSWCLQFLKMRSAFLTLLYCYSVVGHIVGLYADNF